MGSGGVRPGAGAPPKLETQLAKAERLAKRLQSATQSGLARVAESLPRLFDDEVKAALGGDVKARRFLLEMVLGMVRVDERPQTAFGAARQQYQLNIAVVQNVGDESSRVIEATEHHSVPGTGGGVLPPSADKVVGWGGESK